MSKFSTFSALLCALVFGTSAMGQECCEMYVVYETPACCCQPAYVGYASEPFVTNYNWNSYPMIGEEIVSDLIADEVVVNDGETVVVDDPIVYEEQLVWNGCYWESMLVAISDFAGEQVAFESGETHTVGRVPYEDTSSEGVVEGEVISSIPDDKPVSEQELTRELGTDDGQDDVISNDDDFDDGDLKDGDSDDDIDDEGEDGLSDK